MNPVAPIVPRPAMALNQPATQFAHFQPRPVYTQDAAVHRAPIPLPISSITTSITMSNLPTINAGLSTSTAPPYSQSSQVNPTNCFADRYFIVQLFDTLFADLGIINWLQLKGSS